MLAPTAMNFRTTSDHSMLQQQIRSKCLVLFIWQAPPPIPTSCRRKDRRWKYGVSSPAASNALQDVICPDGTHGCSVEQLQQSGSAGLMYCFATNWAGWRRGPRPAQVQAGLLALLEQDHEDQHAPGTPISLPNLIASKRRPWALPTVQCSQPPYSAWSLNRRSARPRPAIDKPASVSVVLGPLFMQWSFPYN